MRPMPILRIRNHTAIPWMALGLVAAHTALILLATACPVDLVPTDVTHRHHGGAHKAVHSSLCAWACQVSSSAALRADTHTAVPVMLLIVLAASSFLAFSASLVGPHRSRAPPAFLLSR